MGVGFIPYVIMDFWSRQDASHRGRLPGNIIQGHRTVASIRLVGRPMPVQCSEEERARLVMVARCWGCLGYLNSKLFEWSSKLSKWSSDWVMQQYDFDRGSDSVCHHHLQFGASFRYSRIHNLIYFCHEVLGGVR